MFAAGDATIELAGELKKLDEHTSAGLDSLLDARDILRSKQVEVDDRISGVVSDTAEAIGNLVSDRDDLRKRPSRRAIAQ